MSGWIPVRVFATIIMDGQELKKKPISALTMQELESECKNLCPSIKHHTLHRALVFNEEFCDYVDEDIDDHILMDKEKIILQFVRPSCSLTEPPKSPDRATPVRQSLQSSLELVNDTLLLSRETPHNTDSSDASLTENEIEERSIIFGRDGRTLNRYQRSINLAAILLAKENPSILQNRGTLLQEARKALHKSGYEYAHGKKTRSKLFGQSNVKKVKTYATESTREERLDLLKEQINSLIMQIDSLEKGKIQAVNSNQYGQAASFEQQIAELKMKLIWEKAEIENHNSQVEKRRGKKEKSDQGKKCSKGVTLKKQSSLTESEIEERSTIFGKDGRKLNRYQRSMNLAAFSLAKENPSILQNRGTLLKEARKAVHELGYEYAHGKKTRSKLFGQSNVKKVKTYATESTREERLDTLKEQINSLNTQIEFLEKGKIEALNSNQYGQAASFEERIAELKMKLRKLIWEKAELENHNAQLEKRRGRRKKSDQGKKGAKGLTFKKERELTLCAEAASNEAVTTCTRKVENHPEQGENNIDTDNSGGENVIDDEGEGSNCNITI